MTIQRTLSGLIITIFLSFSILSTAQAQVSDRDKALSYYASYDYDIAIPYFLRLIEKAPSQDFIEKLADCYYKVNDYKSAELWYEKANKSSNSSKQAIVAYADVLRYNSKYEQAKSAYIRYINMGDVKEKAAALKYVESCDSSIKLSKRYDSEVRLVNEEKLNSKYSDWGTAIYKNGVVIASDRLPASLLKRLTNPKEKENIITQLYGWTGNAYLKFYFSEYKNKQWTKPINFDENINDKYHNASICFMPGNKIAFFTRTNRVNNPSKIAKIGLKEDNFVNRKELYIAYKDAHDKWNKIRPFQYNKVLDYSIQHPAITADGKTLYFASDMAGGLGKFDIYYCERISDSTWTTPVNLGPTINTSENEGFPYIGSDETLYFSSDGHIGLGGLDVFSAMGSKTNWTRLRNMLQPVNSSKDDFAYIYIKEKNVGFLSSNRDGGLGSDDIYRFYKKKSCNFSLYVYDAETELPIEGAVVTIAENMVGSGEFKTDIEGKLDHELSRCYPGNIEVTKVEYAPGYANIEIGKDGKPTNSEIRIPLKKGIAITLEGKVFYQSTGKPVEKSWVLLNNKNDNKQMRVLTDTSGSFKFTLLSGNSYRVLAQKDDYLANSNDVSTKGIKKSTTIFTELKLDRLEIEKAVLLNNIYYDRNSFAIRKDAKPDLDKVVKLMKDNPAIKAELSSHTDSRATTKYNNKLSQQRAEAAVKYIVSKGVSKSRIVAKGYGEQKLVNNCADGVTCSEEEHQQNRRTEFKIIGLINNTSAIGN